MSRARRAHRRRCRSRERCVERPPSLRSQRRGAARPASRQRPCLTACCAPGGSRASPPTRGADGEADFSSHEPGQAERLRQPAPIRAPPDWLQPLQRTALGMRRRPRLDRSRPGARGSHGRISEVPVRAHEPPAGSPSRLLDPGAEGRGPEIGRRADPRSKYLALGSSKLGLRPSPRLGGVHRSLQRTGHGGRSVVIDRSVAGAGSAGWYGRARGDWAGAGPGRAVR